MLNFKSIDNQRKVEVSYLEDLVPKSHILREVNRVINFGFINPLVEPLYYKDNGRPSICPIIPFSLLGYIAQNEREKILERQRQGIEQAKKRGVYNGRPLKYHANAKNSQDRFIYESVVSMLQEKKPVQSIAKHVGIAKSTVYEIQKRIKSIT